MCKYELSTGFVMARHKWCFSFGQNDEGVAYLLSLLYIHLFSKHMPIAWTTPLIPIQVVTKLDCVFFRAALELSVQLSALMIIPIDLKNGPERP